MPTEWYADSSPEEIFESESGGGGITLPVDGYQNPNGNSVLGINDLVSSNFDGSFITSTPALISAGSLVPGNLVYLDDTYNLITSLTNIESYVAYQVTNNIIVSTTANISVLFEDQVLDFAISTSTSVAYRLPDTISAGTSGWAISSKGDAVFNNIIARGNITASSGTIGINTNKWYIGNPYLNGIIANWDQTSSSYPPIGTGGISLNSAGTIEGFTSWVSTSFTVTGVSYVTVGAINYYRYTTSAIHSIQPGNGVFITGLSRYNNSPLTRSPAPVFATTTNTFDIDVTYIQDSYTAAITSENGTVWTAQRLFGIGTGVTLNPDVYMPTYSSTTDGLYFTNTARVPTTQILADGQAVFRGLSQLDVPSTAFIHINPNQANVSTYVSNLTTYISPGAFIIREVIPSSSGNANGLTIDSNDIQQLFISKVSGTEYMSGGMLYLNRLGGNVTIGAASGSSIYIPSAYTVVPTTTKSLFVGSNGQIGVAPSSRRFKSNINIVNISNEIDNLLDLNLVTFQYNQHIQELGVESAPVTLGFIAEEAAELGLTYLYSCDNEGLPDYFAYDKLPLYMFIQMKRQRDKINELEQRLAILEG